MTQQKGVESNIELDWEAAEKELLEDTRYCDRPSLVEALSPELLFKILLFLQWNDILPLASTCRVLRDIVYSRGLWTHMKEIDFNNIAMPFAHNMLKVCQMCHNAECLYIGDVILDEEVDEVEVDNINDADDEPIRIQSSYNALLSQLFQASPKLHHVSLSGHRVTNRSVAAVVEGCPLLRSLEVKESAEVSNHGLAVLLTSAHTLTHLQVSQCPRVVMPSIGAQEEQPLHLALTHISLHHCHLLPSNVASFGKNCPSLKVLDLTGSVGLAAILPEEIKKEDFQALEELNLGKSQTLYSVQLVDMPSLKILDLELCYMLDLVECTAPQLNKLHLTHCERLARLKVHSDCLEELVCAELTDLATVDLVLPNLRLLNLSKCLQLRLNQIIDMTGLSGIVSLNLTGCKMHPEDISNQLLHKMPKLTSFQHGCNTWGTFPLSSPSLQTVHVSDILCAPSLELNTENLHTLLLENCRDISELEFVKALLPSDKGLTGDTKCVMAPRLAHLNLTSMPGFHGEIFSKLGTKLAFLSELELIACPSLRILNLVDWPCLESIKVSGCQRLKHLTIISPKVKYGSIRWCGLLEYFSLNLPVLQYLDLTGTNYKRFELKAMQLTSFTVFGLMSVHGGSVNMSCPDLKRLHLIKCSNMTTQNLDGIFIGCPKLKSIHLTGCSSIREIHIPQRIEILSFIGLPKLSNIYVPNNCQLQEMELRSLPKLDSMARKLLYKHTAIQLVKLEIWAASYETEINFNLPNLLEFGMDQGVNVKKLDLNCPKLATLKLKGCPRLDYISLRVTALDSIDISQSLPLMALRTLHLSTNNVHQLSLVLEKYCPRVKKISLDIGKIFLGELLKLGQACTTLQEIAIVDCQVMDSQLNRIYPNNFFIPKEKMYQRQTDLHVIF